MKRWAQQQLGAILGSAGTGIILDPDRLLDDTDIADLHNGPSEVHTADTWADLRVLWDLELRPRKLTSDVLVLVRSPDFISATDLPWDVEHQVFTVIRLRWPVPIDLRAAFRSTPTVADELADAANSNHTTCGILSTALRFQPGDPAGELNAVARLRSDPTTGDEIWGVLAPCLSTDLAHQTAANAGDLGVLQSAWNDWLAGRTCPYAAQLESSPGALVPLLASGLLTAAPAIAPDLPPWATIGITAPDPAALFNGLLTQRPSPAATLADWIETAAWWGSVRSAAADCPTDADELWETWSELDAEFGQWLRTSYGSSLQSASPTPRALHQVAPFLARRIEDGAKILLIVIDGLGFAQWTRLRVATGLHVAVSTGCLAVIPTLTTVSRQAIFAGSLPVDFEDTLDSTRAEERRWKSFWAANGVKPNDVSYAKVLGATRTDVPEITGRVAAVVVNAVDEILHGAEVLGDRQVATNVDLWANSGFLTQIVSNGNDQGYEIWITSDHGNIPTTPGPVPREGQTVESAGTRVRLYPNITLREQASDFGAIWDPPGVPVGKLNPMFARGRAGFHRTGVRVSHGGMSLDEVIVPFVRVAP
jgi:hypothetical protein